MDEERLDHGTDANEHAVMMGIQDRVDRTFSHARGIDRAAGPPW